MQKADTTNCAATLLKTGHLALDAM